MYRLVWARPGDAVRERRDALHSMNRVRATGNFAPPRPSALPLRIEAGRRAIDLRVCVISHRELSGGGSRAICAAKYSLHIFQAAAAQALHCGHGGWQSPALRLSPHRADHVHRTYGALPSAFPRARGVRCPRLSTSLEEMAEAAYVYPDSGSSWARLRSPSVASAARDDPSITPAISRTWCVRTWRLGREISAGGRQPLRLGRLGRMQLPLQHGPQPWLCPPSVAQLFPSSSLLTPRARSLVTFAAVI